VEKVEFSASLEKSSLVWGVAPKLINKKHNRAWKIFQMGMFFVFIACMLSAAMFCHYFGLLELPRTTFSNVVVDIFVMELLTLIFLGCVRSVSFEQTNVCFLCMIAICFFFNYLDTISWFINGHDDWRVINIFVNALYFICPVEMTCMFFYFADSIMWTNGSKSTAYKRLINIISILTILLSVANAFFGFFFTVDANGTYVRNGHFFHVSFLLPCTLVILCIAYVLKSKLSAFDKITLVLCPIIPFVGSVGTFFAMEAAHINTMTFLLIFLIYINLFIRREQELEKKQKNLAETEINAMILQINPHFIYNTLGSIGSLCVEQPEKSRETISLFSGYLRSNLSEMSQRRTIPFTRELEHLSLYLEIEKIRFPDITVCLNTPVTDFELPSLSVQPLVENAITHGIMGREAGGTITISTFEDKHNFFVRVEDDGIGFKKIPTDDGRKHIGIHNVSQRLNMLCEGELKIESTVGKGTTATIRIPKGRSL